MDKVERVKAVIEGRQPDHPPFSCWHHFRAGQAAGSAALEAHVRHVEAYDLDFLKIMDDNRYPRTKTSNGIIREVDDLDRLTVLSGDEDSFGRQLDLIADLAKRYGGQLLMATTLFNSWATLRGMTMPDTGVHGPPSLEETKDPRDETMARFLDESPAALERALQVIAESSANFARHCLSAGADGIFLSVRDDWVDNPENGDGTYDRLVRQTDLDILDGAAEAGFNLLHICGQALDFDRFAQYPVQVINWADRYAEPKIADVVERVKPAICGGLDNLGTMAKGSPEECAEEVADALAQAKGRPIMIAPGCTFDPDAVSPENLHAIRRAVHQA
jgi:uroporphyrinogen decarboxylase